MIIPVRCFSCGGVIAHKWEEFKELKAAGLDDAEALDKEDQNTGARGLAWPILGGWGPSDPSSNLGGPT